MGIEPKLGAAASALAVLSAMLLGACAGSGPSSPPVPPVITVSGVADGMEYDGPITIQIDVDRGTYQATLDGAPFLSGSAVSTVGEHTLHVTARAGTAESERMIVFRVAPAPGGLLIVRLIDLGPNGSGGGGDAILVTDSTASGMVHALIDAGPAGASASDEGFVARRLQALGVDTLAFMLLTHAHSDHFQGMTDVLNQVHVRRFYYNGQERSLSFYQSLLALARSRADTVIVPTDTIAIALGGGGSRLTLVPPLPTFLNDAGADGDELNEGSVGALLRRDSFGMYFTGDGEERANARWRTQFGQLTGDVEVLKVGHHGANNAIFDNGFSGESSWLEHTSPEVSVISANGVSHPRVNALTRLLQQTNMRTYCTNVHGDITIRVASDGTYTVTVERLPDSDCVPGTQADT